MTVVGGANIDIHGRSTRALRAHDSNPGTVCISAGGVARNIAENLVRLGVDCRLITAVGDDHNGRTLVRLASEAGIDTQYVQEITSAQTSTYLSVIDTSGDMAVAIADMDIIDQLTPARLRPCQSMLHQSSLIVLDTNLPDSTLAWLAREFAEQTLFVDTVSTTKAPRIKAHLGSIHTLKTSAIEAEALTGLKAETRSQLQDIASQLHAAGVERVFVTRGSQGVFYSTADEQGTFKLSQKNRIVRNAGGAGDAFLAGLAYSWLENHDLENTLRVALTAAELTLSD
ncbi:MAG TPA: carbohydrate kinase family protein, partial [Woeseiaceae bacterium]|nr:carbohydrate kinase family protein [Woeseiaceae bacterium]